MDLGRKGKADVEKEWKIIDLGMVGVGYKYGFCLIVYKDNMYILLC